METTVNVFQKTFLEESNIQRIKRMFENENLYIEYMNTLLALRSATFKTLEIIGLDNRGKNHPNYKIFKVTNELIDALLIDGYRIENNKITVKYNLQTLNY